MFKPEIGYLRAISQNGLASDGTLVSIQGLCLDIFVNDVAGLISDHRSDLTTKAKEAFDLAGSIARRTLVLREEIESLIDLLGQETNLENGQGIYREFESSHGTLRNDILHLEYLWNSLKEEITKDNSQANEGE